MTATLTPRELREVDDANAGGQPPVVFVHGLWLLASSWDTWRRLFEAAGFATLAPGWPDDPESVEEARRRPGVFAGKSVQQVTDHYSAAIRRLARRPAVVGHSFGGLIAQKLAGAGASVATVAVDPVPFRGVLPVPLSTLRSAAAVLSRPANRGRAVTLTYAQFRYGWANALPEDEARRLYDEYHVAGSGRPVFQAVAANLNPFTEMRVDTRNPDRGPLLIISGEQDHTVPVAQARAAFRRQGHNPAVTELIELPERGHSLTVDHGWREVATTALDFVRTYGPLARST